MNMTIINWKGNTVWITVSHYYYVPDCPKHIVTLWATDGGYRNSVSVKNPGSFRKNKNAVLKKKIRRAACKMLMRYRKDVREENEQSSLDQTIF